MSAAALFAQLLNGLASASSLFLAAAGLTLVFGVTRIVNFAHGSLYMLGAFCAVSLIGAFGPSPLGFWGGVLLAGVATGVLGLAVETLLLRRLYAAPELLQLLATFALVLVLQDLALGVWGPEDRLGPRAPGLSSAVTIAGRAVPQFDLFLIALGPAVLAALWWLLRRTRWGTLVRAAAEDREMAGALGVNQAWLYTSVFTLGAFLAGLGGAVNLPRESANLGMDLSVIADVFVVVVVGGMGSIPGAFLAALLISVVKSLCIGLGEVHLGGLTVSLSKLTLAIEFVIMAVVLVLRPWGLLGAAQPRARAGYVEEPLRTPPRYAIAAGVVVLALLAALPAVADPYTLVLLGDIFVFALFAVSLHFIVGPGGMHSFGHAAYFGLGAYAAALALKHWMPMEPALALGVLAAAAGAALYGWFCVRLSGIYLAMLTLAFAQITWAVVYQWDTLTGGSNGLIGVWPPAWLASHLAYYFFTLALCAGGVALLWRILYSPFGYALRAGRDSPLRAEAIGIDVARVQWSAFVLAGAFAGLAGAVYAFSKGSISPEVAAIPRSVDGLIMVLLGGAQTLTGPVWGAAAFTWLHDAIARATPYWRAALGAIVLVIVLAFPAGLGGLGGLLRAWRERTAA